MRTTFLRIALSMAAALTLTGCTPVQIIQGVANKFHVSAELMLGVAACESGFTHNVSSSGARGIFQFLPSTFRSLRSQLGLDPNASPDDDIAAAETVARYLQVHGTLLNSPWDFGSHRAGSSTDWYVAHYYRGTSLPAYCRNALNDNGVGWVR